ncbi:hypothetical protein KJ756_00530 [Patescibacteria group bacterium]|nr:hypothetical protein [Patescibacteria group bacterium]MCG2809597.1 hypothetical protein [Candidatus Portnoybacteria bacterium]
MEKEGWDPEKTIYFDRDPKKEQEKQIDSEIEKRKKAGDKKEVAGKTFENWLKEKKIKEGEYLRIFGDVIIKVNKVDFNRGQLDYKLVDTGNNQTLDFAKLDSTFELRGTFSNKPELSSNSEAIQMLERSIKRREEENKKLQEQLVRGNEYLARLKALKESEEIKPENKNK